MSGLRYGLVGAGFRKGVFCRICCCERKSRFVDNTRVYARNKGSFYNRYMIRPSAAAAMGGASGTGDNSNR